MREDARITQIMGFKNQPMVFHEITGTSLSGARNVGTLLPLAHGCCTKQTLPFEQFGCFGSILGTVVEDITQHDGNIDVACHMDK